MSKTKAKLDLEINKMFAEAKPLTQEELHSFGEKNREIMERPSFKAGVVRDQLKHETKEKPPYDETKVFSACVLIGSILVGAVGLIIAIITHSIK